MKPTIYNRQLFSLENTKKKEVSFLYKTENIEQCSVIYGNGSYDKTSILKWFWEMWDKFDLLFEIG